ncbi:MAG TPA: lamin tail domain-containing protein, partial [Chthoniobacteraceae bacterium]|nr:lamin tail domain-containing protein [Chthoniobacteraceae bacterium]
PGLAGGDGSSLELANPNADNSLGGAWRDSDESTKTTFQTVTINGGNYQDVTRNSINDDEIRIWTTGDSHIVMKNFVLKQTNGSGNLLVNGEVTTLTNGNVVGWQSRGTHGQTFHDGEGVHLVADGGGDNKCNHMEKDAAGMTLGVPYTLTFDARWVYGSPRLVVQSWDLSWGGIARLPIPNNLGTPGAQNSRLAAAPPPQVTALNHSPVKPATGQLVTVTARVSSAAPVSGVQLLHRLDTIGGNGGWSTSSMVDNGLSGDAQAGDGVYTAQINPGSFAGYNTNAAIVQFYVRATADNGQIGELPRSGAATPGMWVVDNSVPSADLRRMRVIISAYWGDALNQDSPTGGNKQTPFNFKYPRLANRFFPCVVIVNDSTIYYDCGVHKTGSPFTRTTNNTLDRGRVAFPGDKKFRGKTRFYWDNDGVGGTMLHNRIHRYWMYLLGIPSNENEVCRVAKNTGYTVRETNEVFDRDMLSRMWENGNDGTFYEMDDRFWIGDDGTTLVSNDNGTWDYKTGDSQGQDNPTAYHNQFVPHSREVEYDYSAFLAWCQQLEQNPTAEMLERMADTKAMTAYAAIRGYTADWDNITMSRGKNGYLYNRSTDRKWMMLHWDSDLSFQDTHINDPPIGGLTNVGTYYARPFVRRYLNFFFSEMLTTYASNGPRIGAWLTAEENASSAYNVPTTYVNWPNMVNNGLNRPTVIRNFMGSTSFNAQFVTTFPGSGSTILGNTVDVLGTAPPSAFSVICVNHSEAVLTWTATSSANTAPWRLAGIQLKSGVNTLTFRMLNINGDPIGSDIMLTLNKSGNAPPVVNLAVDPSSQNAELGQPVNINADQSYDPEAAGPVTYAWSVTPAVGFSMLAPTPTQRVYTFTTPGSYTISVEATDADGQIATAARVISVYSASGFDSFNGNILSGYAVENVELLDNSPDLAWYSLNETDNNLVISLIGSSSMPVRAGAPGFPLVTRPLPASVDCLLQTDLTLETRKVGLTGTFLTGLYIETLEGGVLTRYVFGIDAGTTFKVWRSVGGASYTQAATSAFAGGDITIRVQRIGSNLEFQRKGNGVWATVFTQGLQGGSTLTRGGVFASSGAVNSNVTTPGSGLRVAFDYLLLADPGNTTELVGNLRITEIMYNPAGAGGIEFVELRNFGPTPINLNGAYFEDSTPFSAQFTFGDLTLQPGQYCVVTNVTPTEFSALYGPGITVAGQFAGGLSNDGEQIVLRDVEGNLIHDFTFDDIAPWPLTPDGQGPSLEASVNNPALYGLGTSWRASYEIGGTPGYTGLAVDSDEDSFSDGYELAFGGDPNNAGSQPPPPTTTRVADSGHVMITWASQNGRLYTIQYRNDLTSGMWQPLGSVTATGPSATFTDTTATGEIQRFYRLATDLP